MYLELLCINILVEFALDILVMVRKLHSSTPVTEFYKAFLSKLWLLKSEGSVYKKIRVRLQCGSKHSFSLKQNSSFFSLYFKSLYTILICLVFNLLIYLFIYDLSKNRWYIPHIPPFENMLSGKKYIVLMMDNAT